MKKGIGQSPVEQTEKPIRVVSGRKGTVPPHIKNLFNLPIDFLELLDEIAIGVAVLDLDRKIVAMNHHLKAITGFSQEKILGVACCYILRSNVCLQKCPALSINESTGPKCVEGNLINRDRQLIPVRITTAPLKNLDGRMVGFMETVEDISLLRRLDETRR